MGKALFLTDAWSSPRWNSRKIIKIFKIAEKPLMAAGPHGDVDVRVRPGVWRISGHRGGAALSPFQPMPTRNAQPVGSQISRGAQGAPCPLLLPQPSPPCSVQPVLSGSPFRALTERRLRRAAARRCTGPSCPRYSRARPSARWPGREPSPGPLCTHACPRFGCVHVHDRRYPRATPSKSVLPWAVLVHSLSAHPRAAAGDRV